MNPLFLFFCLSVAREYETVDRTEKERYDIPVRECERATELLDERPLDAIEILNRILSGRELALVERRVRIALGRETFTRVYPFHPFQLRGRAWMKLAARAASRGEFDLAAEYTTRAADDFEYSAALGLRSSRELLASAVNALDETRARRARSRIDLQAVVARLLGGLEEPDPDRALADVEKLLKAHAERWDDLSPEARRSLVTLRIATAALRGFRAGRSEEDVARDLAEFRAKLREVGGPEGGERFGPKVREVLRRLQGP
ncbi:MAG: hypothetical protein HYY17_02505 [Planctomycetes bacterium]|nr:hypothetical protein [Planctomycetota bacterium]